MALRFSPPTRWLYTALLAVTIAACTDTIEQTPPPPPPPPPPTLTTLNVAIPVTAVAMGQTATATVSGLDQNGAAIAVTDITWSTSPNHLASVSPTGLVTGRAAGTVEVIATSGGVTGQKSLTVNPTPLVRINEVESNGGTPGDWVELLNPTTAAIDLSGWVVRDNDDTHSYTLPNGTTIAPGALLLVEEAALGFGLGTPDAVRLFSQYGVLVDTYGWTPHATTTYGRCPSGSGEFGVTTVSTKGAANDCSLLVKINEVESNGGTPGDWVEIINLGGAPANLSGYAFKDNDDTHNYILPVGSIIPAGGFLVLEEAAFGFGLGGAESARLYSPTGTVLETYTWDVHAAITYGRCPDGTGAFAATTASSKGAANVCSAIPPTSAPWPAGGDDVTTVDGISVFQTNLSGLTYEGAVGGSPAVLWAVRNGPGTLYRLIFSGGIWTPDPANGWATGKPTRYADGLGNPDSEGITFAAGGSAGGIYVATERNNDASTISRSSILRFDPNQATLTATNDWNITADLPVVGANLGIEAITWVPDTYLTSQGFFDEAAAHTYVPAEYANHGTGLFFVGVEGNGTIYVYALNHVTNGFTRVATILSGFTGVMGLEFDRELNYLWATCDDGCGGKSATLEIDLGGVSPTKGRFIQTHVFDRPATMPNLNNEGFAIAPQSECVGGKKPVFWSDDAETGGHSIRRATLPCVRFP